ncbi:hypothetical protein DRQ36_07990 [bacterium]|nr:MAG: hypothetical protein DRQ36_07990 [bacterium]
MQKALFVVILSLALLLSFGCEKCEECEDCPPCDTFYICDTLYDTLVVCDTIVVCDSNYTDIDPPFIEEISGPHEITLGGEAAFGCSVLTDAPLVRMSWDLFAETGENIDYFYPADPTEGPFTPWGTVPATFIETDTGASPTHTYDKRGKYTAVLEIEDEDGYIEHDGFVVFAVPTVPDTNADPRIVRAGIPDSIYGEDFELLRFGLIADNRIPVSVYADSYDQFHAFANINSDYLPGPNYIQTRVETGKCLRIEGAGDFRMEITVDYDIAGALHIRGGDIGDYVRYSAYMTLRETGGFPETHYLYSYTLDGIDGDQAYYINNEQVITDTVIVWGMLEYEFWFGVETVQFIGGSGGTGSSVCFDGTDGFTKLNKIKVYMEK